MKDKIKTNKGKVGIFAGAVSLFGICVGAGANPEYIAMSYTAIAIVYIVCKTIVDRGKVDKAP